MSDTTALAAAVAALDAAVAALKAALGQPGAPTTDPDRLLPVSKFVAEKIEDMDPRSTLNRHFGIALSNAYMAEHGHRPPKDTVQYASGGCPKRVVRWTEADRPFMERVWASFNSEEVAR